MPMKIETIERSIQWQVHVRDRSLDPAQKARCNAAIERLLRDAMDVRRAEEERALDRGTLEHAAWYDTSEEVR